MVGAYLKDPYGIVELKVCCNVIVIVLRAKNYMTRRMKGSEVSECNPYKLELDKGCFDMSIC